MEKSLVLEETSSAINYRYYLHQYWNDVCDPRTLDLPLMRNGPWTLIGILFVYLLLVTKVGPHWMRNRKPYELRGPMLAYNFIMVVINLFFMWESINWLNFGRKLIDFKFPSANDRSPGAQRIVSMFHWYFMSKFVDFMDTFFFVFRKKYNQISFLHLYHHVSVPIIGWISAWVGPTMPVLGLFALLNSFVHVVMYSYYALAALGPQIQKYLWWKKNITQIQLIQFAIIGFYGILINVYHVGYPMIYRLMPVSQGPIFFVMFANFYLKSYRKKKLEKCH